MLSWAREAAGEKGALPSLSEEVYLDGLTTGTGKEKAVQIKEALPESWPVTAVPGGFPNSAVVEGCRQRGAIVLCLAFIVLRPGFNFFVRLFNAFL